MATATETETEKQVLYEGMFLVDSNKFANDSEGVTQAILDVIEKCGGTVVVHRPWQDGKLAYVIEKKRKGVHYLAYFKMPASGMTAFDRACKLNDLIIRQMVIKHPPELFNAMVAAISGVTEEAAEVADAPAPSAE